MPEQENAPLPPEESDAPETETQDTAPDASKEAPPPSLSDEAESLCASLEKYFRKKLGDMPSRMDMAELRSQQGAIRELVRRGEEEGAQALIDLAKVAGERDREKENAARAKADFLNYQTRSQNDLKRAEELALRGYVSDLLPIFDSLDLTLADVRSGKADLKRVSEALEMLAQAFEQALKVRGLERISAQGRMFDPAHHEAVATRPIDTSADEKPNQVVEEFRPGYLWKGLLLRPAQVLVTQADSEKTAPPGEKK